MPDAPSPMRELSGVTPDTLTDALLTAPEPYILRGLAADWPFVRAARDSSQAASRYLNRLYTGEPVVAYLGAPDIGGRFDYTPDLNGFNFATVEARLDLVLEELEDHKDDAAPPACYVGSTAVDHYLPGFRAENDLDLAGRKPLVSIWVGNRTRIAAHYDFPDNIAVCAAGRRRFTLFPPEQLPNLYVGPIDFTPAGQAISLVDVREPDLERFPRFAEALRHAQVAELEPGDAIFIPSMWWHHVEALAPFNALVNYWWTRTPAWMGTPAAALQHAMLSIRALPPEQRRAWQEAFRHYVFEADDATSAHIPERARRILAPLDDDSGPALRAQIAKRFR